MGGGQEGRERGRQGRTGKPAGMEERKRKRKQNKKTQTDGETRVSGSHRSHPPRNKAGNSEAEGPGAQCSSCSLDQGTTGWRSSERRGKLREGTPGPCDEGQPGPRGGCGHWVGVCTPIGGRCSAQRGKGSQGPGRVGMRDYSQKQRNSVSTHMP